MYINTRVLVIIFTVGLTTVCLVQVMVKLSKKQITTTFSYSLCTCHFVYKPIHAEQPNPRPAVSTMTYRYTYSWVCLQLQLFYIPHS